MRIKKFRLIPSVCQAALFTVLWIAPSALMGATNVSSDVKRLEQGTLGEQGLSALYSAPRDEVIPEILSMLRAKPGSSSRQAWKEGMDVLARHQAGDYPEAFDLAMSSLNDSYVFRECVEILASAPPNRSQEVVDTLVAYLLRHRDDSPRFTEACNGIYRAGNGNDTGATRVRPFADYTATDSQYALSESAAACRALIGMMGMSDYLDSIDTGPAGEKAAFLFALWWIATDTQGNFNVDDSTRQRIVHFIFDSYTSPDTVVVNQAIRYGTSAIVLGHYMGKTPSLPKHYVDSALITLDNIASSSTDSIARTEAASRSERLREFIAHEETGR